MTSAAQSSLLRRFILGVVPRAWAERLRRAPAWRARRDRQTARRLARSTKRLDHVAAQVARTLHLAGRPSLEGLRVLELGAGWVLSHSLVFHLLGARSVVAFDVERLAKLDALRQAVELSDPSMILEQLGPFADPARLRGRWQALRRAPLDEARLVELGIDYRAPASLLDGAGDGEALAPVDLVYSNSVLEHVPAEDCPRLVRGLSRLLTPEGAMLHAIHLEDHRDFVDAPFAFLAAGSAPLDAGEQSVRGNRLRASAWLSLLSDGGALRVETLHSATREALLLPATIDSAVVATGELDLRTSHLLVRVTRRAD